MSRMGRALKNPRTSFGLLIALCRGLLIKLWCRLRGSQVSIGSSFRAYCWLTVRGPGEVRIGNKVTIGRGFQRKPSILTHARAACVTVGDETFLGGTRISCATSVTIGTDNLFGSVTVIDSDVLPTPHRPLDEARIALHAGPITIGSRCWLGTNAFVLRDVVLGDECVLSAGAVVRDKTAEDGVLLGGNPARSLGSMKR